MTAHCEVSRPLARNQGNAHFKWDHVAGSPPFSRTLMWKFLPTVKNDSSLKQFCPPWPTVYVWGRERTRSTVSIPSGADSWNFIAYVQVCSCVCEMGLHWIGHAIYNNCCNIGLFNVDLSWQKVSCLLSATTKVLDIGRHFIFSSVCIVCNLSRKKLKHTRNEKKLLTSLPDRVLNVLAEI